MSKLFRCEPTILPLETEGSSQAGLKVQLLQGGLHEGKPTIHFTVGAGVEFRIYCSELRQSVDILEPAPKKRERKKVSKKPTPKAAVQLSKEVS